MSNPVTRLLRHPRRLGFVAFNLVVVGLLAAWIVSGPFEMEAGLVDLPNWVLANVGMVFLLVAWVVAWLAWGLMVLSRRRRLQSQRAG